MRRSLSVRAGTAAVSDTIDYTTAMVDPVDDKTFWVALPYATSGAEMKAAIAVSGETPLEYMLRIMRDEAAKSTRRDDMAKAAAPLHPRLSSVEHTGDTGEFRTAADMTDDELAAIVAGAKLTVVK